MTVLNVLGSDPASGADHRREVNAKRSRRKTHPHAEADSATLNAHAGRGTSEASQQSRNERLQCRAWHPQDEVPLVLTG